MNKILFIIPLLTICLFAENLTIQGYVLNSETNQGLSDVNIEIIDQDRGTFTNEKGKFSLTVDTNELIKVSRIGYISRTIKINKSNPINIYLKPTVLQLNSVNISGKKKVDPIAQPNIETLSINNSIIQINANQITRQNSQTLIDALNFAPAGHVESRGRKVKQFFSIRGQKYPYPDIAINGITMKEFHENTYFFHSENIEKIEIIPTTTAILKGFSPMAGIVNIKTRQFFHPTTIMKMEYGNYNSSKLSVTHGAKKGKFSYSTSMSYMGTDGPSNKHAAEKTANFYGNIKYQPDDNFYIQSNLFYINGNREIAFAEAPAAKKYLDFIQEYDPVNTLVTNLQVFHKQSEKSSSLLTFYFSDRKPKMIMQKNHDAQEVEIKEYDSEFGVKAIQSLRFLPKNNLRIAAAYTHWEAPEGKRFYVGKECITDNYSAIITDEHHFEKFTINMGLRYDLEYLGKYGAFNINGSPGGLKNVAPISDQWQKPIMTASAGLTHNINSTSVIAINLARGNVQPMKGIVTSDFKKPTNEIQNKTDISLKSSSAFGNITSSVFYTFQKDAIVLNGKTWSDSTTGLIHEFYENRDQNNYGIELSYHSLRFWNLAEFFVNGTFMQSQYKNAGKMEINKEFPNIILNTGFYSEYNNLDLNILAKYVSEYENDRFSSSGPQPLGNYCHIDLTAGYRFQKKPNIRIYIHINNLLDDKYSTVVGYPDFGREFKTGISIKL